MKRLMFAMTIVMLASSLSGCIIDDRRPGGYYNHDNYCRWHDCRGGWRR